MDPDDRHASDRLGTLQPHVIRKCRNATCGVRFPVAAANEHYAVCHLCEAPTDVVAEIVRHDGTVAEAPGRTLIGVVDNVRSAMNVGTIIRCADGAGMRRVHLGGISPAADNPKVIKTSLGAEASIECRHHPDLVPAIDRLRAEGVIIVTCEATPESVALDALPSAALRDAPVAIVVGNEIAGVDPAILERSDHHVHIPMRGVKNSLNVAVAFGIAVWHLGRI